MSAALLPRTAVVAVYLVALLLTGRGELLTGLLAVAVVALWFVALLRDRMTRHVPVPTTQPR